MARSQHRLSAKQVANAPIGMHPDGGGLYLQVTKGANNVIRRSWIYRYADDGRERHMGLGSLADISLAAARQQALAARALRLSGKDPIEARQADRAAIAKANATAITFDDAAAAYIGAHRAGWKNPKHPKQWEASLARYASPVIGKVFVRDVDTGLVMQVLEPIWAKKPETASRVRQRIECILDWARVRGHREGENPARLKGHLDHLLAKRSKARTVQHHPALAYSELPAFLKRLRAQRGIAAKALEFTILTAARTAETIGATAAEINTREKLWTVPKGRMKGEREHRVPLCDRALALIAELVPLRGNTPFIFPGERSNGSLSNMAMLNVLSRMECEGMTVHGFRSTFRDWAAERTNFPNEVVEMALAHAVSDKVEAAYRRGDLFDKRRRLMEAWAEFCEHGKTSADVVPLRA